MARRKKWVVLAVCVAGLVGLLCWLGSIGWSVRHARSDLQRPDVRNQVDGQKPPSLARADLFPAQYRDAVRNVSAFLATKGETAGTFYLDFRKFTWACEHYRKRRTWPFPACFRVRDPS